MGIGGIIVHGLYTWNATANVLLREFGGSDPSSMKEFQARFAAPVRPGAKIVIKMWKARELAGSATEIRFVTAADGVVVLGNGRAFIQEPK